MSKGLYLGNLSAARDWGHAKDYVRAMHMILQLDQPDDFVCATGISHTVKDLCEYVFSKLGMNYETYIDIDAKFIRPEELYILRGDPTKLKQATGWEPEYTFETMLDEMINYWLNYYSK